MSLTNQTGDQMAASRTPLATTISFLFLTACGAGPPADQAVPGTAAATSSPTVRACDLLDLAAATSLIGSGTEHPGGDTERDTCVYSNAGVAILTIQIGSAQLYDQVTIAPPHTPVAIGDRGRHHVESSGAVSTQFVKGAYSVTISIQPLGSPARDYLNPLLAAARQVAGALP